MKILLLLIILSILISICVSTNIDHIKFDDNNNENNIFFSNLKEDKSINEIINKGYNKLVGDLKLKNQYHNNEKKFQKLALEKQKLKPMGYKCKHDHVMNQHILRTKDEINSKNNNNFETHNNNNNIEQLNEGVQQLQDTASVSATSSPIRFNIDTTYISGTNDKYACYKVGDNVTVGSTDATKPCKSDGSVFPCIKTCVAADVQTTTYQQFLITSIVETMVEIFQSRLKVINPQSSFKWNYASNGGTCSYGVPIPSNFYTTGVSNTDMYVYVTSRPYSSADTVAYASPCNFATTSTSSGTLYGRPTGANINFCPTYFTGFVGQENSVEYNMFVRTGIHEMTHALGFSSTFYQSYVEPNTQTKIRNGAGAAASYSFSGTTPAGQIYSVSKSGIFSNNVVAFAKNHYNCDSITNVELEDDGGSGTSGSHWEMRTVGEEYMLGYISPVMPITGLTMAILQDSGWYEIDTSANEQLVYGKGLGCNFVQKMCSPQNWNFTGYFCSINGQTGCTGTRAGKGRCTIYQLSSPPQPLYQHFANPNLIGVTYTADGCPFIRVENYNSYCFDTSKQSTANSAIYEEYTDNSKCFEYKNPTNQAINQACWQQRCVNNTLQIKINTDWINCPDSSTVVSNGITVVCPISYNICSDSSSSSSTSSSSSSSSSSSTTSTPTSTSTSSSSSSSLSSSSSSSAATTSAIPSATSTPENSFDINTTSTLLPSLLIIIFITILNYLFNY